MMAMIKFLDLEKFHAPILQELEEAVGRVVASGWYIGGEEVRFFEEDFARYLDVKHCIGCASGTDALELILRAYEIGPGDEVIVPAMTWVSDAEAVSLVGATPVFADILEGEYTLSPQALSKQITGKTKAIIAVHLYGLPCRMDEILALAKQHDLVVIEDCAQAHGAMYKGKKVGGLGVAAAFSFYPTKNLGALGDAGAVTCNDAGIAEKVRLISNHGQRKRDEHLVIGKTSRLDPIQAAVLRVKLNYLDRWNSLRISNAHYLQAALQDSPLTLPSMPNGCEHVFHQFVIQPGDRDTFRRCLMLNGIETAIHYPNALPQLPAFKQGGYAAGDFPMAEKLAREAVSLPILVNESDLDQLVEGIKGAVGKDLT